MIASAETSSRSNSGGGGGGGVGDDDDQGTVNGDTGDDGNNGNGGDDQHNLDTSAVGGGGGGGNRDSSQTNKNDKKTCVPRCETVCTAWSVINTALCPRLCKTICQKYDKEAQLSGDAFKCLILCEGQLFAKDVCATVCRLHLNKTHDDECVGNGKERCYKLCRLQHKQSIAKCKIACCQSE